MVVQYILSEPMGLWALIFLLKLVGLNLDTVGDPQCFFSVHCAFGQAKTPNRKKRQVVFSTILHVHPITPSLIFQMTMIAIDTYWYYWYILVLLISLKYQYWCYTLVLLISLIAINIYWWLSINIIKISMDKERSWRSFSATNRQSDALWNDPAVIETSTCYIRSVVIF